MKALIAISWMRFSWSSALSSSGSSVKAPLGMDYEIVGTNRRFDSSIFVIFIIRERELEYRNKIYINIKIRKHISITR